MGGSIRNFFGILSSFFVLPPLDEDQRVVLLIDSHCSHTSVPLLREARDNKVELVPLPSHTSHCLQPLDVSVFASFKKSWRERCRQLMSNNPGKIISRAEFGSLFSSAYAHSASADKAIAGRCGHKLSQMGSVLSRF